MQDFWPENPRKNATHTCGNETSVRGVLVVRFRTMSRTGQQCLEPGMATNANDIDQLTQV